MPNPKSKKVTARKVSNMINRHLSKKSETKRFLQKAQESAVISSAASVVFTDLSQIAQGTTSGTRVGNIISPFGVHLSYILHNNSAVAGYARVLLVKVPDGTFTAVNDNIFAATDGAGAAPIAERLTDVFEMVNKYKMEVLLDKTHRLAGLGDGTGIETVMRKGLMKLRSQKWSYLGSAAADNKDDNLRLYVIFRCADNDTTAATIEFSYQSTVYYKDY